ncbi:hypothetical protein KIH86_00950 [Paenibacillus sp. HN-1]|uniref:hypothetical protein n=1 Tax=Paenibacillus TaxID=44249 RepID=UPI001CA8DFE7|nr:MULTISPECIES: hypothetical protein [Paenibacillus]MBY9078508.1 hypothetical protein [Paenibacillus sp. CGMCC 1.18879]MBY9082801.1 hypothetical protein [Paenibacillus sinensis]
MTPDLSSFHTLRRNTLLGLAVALGTIGSAEIAAVTVSAEAAAPAATASADQSLAVYNQFERYLTNAAKTPSSLIQARNYLLNHIKQTDSWRATVMVLHLENVQKTRLDTFSEKIYPERVQQILDAAYRKGGIGKGLTYTSLMNQVTDSSVKALLTELFGYGYKLETSEGMYYPVMNYEGFKPFKAHIGKDIAAYIDLMAAESNRPALSDAAIVITWDELIGRGLVMEKFVSQYPFSNRNAAVKDLLKLRSLFIFYGASNTPAYSYGASGEPTQIDPKLKQAYEDAVSDGTGGSQILNDIQTLLGILDKNGGIWNADVEAFLRKYQQPTG